MNLWKAGRGQGLKVLCLTALFTCILPFSKIGSVGAFPLFETTGDGFSPRAIVQAAEGEFLAVDGFNQVIWKITEDGRSIYGGRGGGADRYGEPRGGYRDGPLRDMRMNDPWDIVPYLEGYAVSDRGNHVVRYISSKGSMTAAGTGKGGYEDNLAAKAVFGSPTGLAVDEGGVLYIADTDNDVVRSLSPSGKVDTYLRGLSAPTGLCYHQGALYVADTGNNRIVKVVDGAVIWTAGTGEEGFRDGPVSQAAFSGPQRITAAEDGTIYVADTGNSAVRKILEDSVTTLPSAEADRPGLTLASPEGMLVSDGSLLVCDGFLKKIFALPG
ncbi:MAG: hypothetical protein LIP16_20520 [Clostridium sp.]|nr:hypothetical protein [Clostridium sp.]